MSIETDILGSIGGLRNNSLNHILHANTFENNENLDYEVTTIKHSPYVDHLEFLKSFKEKQDEFCILSLNIQSLNAKFDELVILLHSLTNCKFSAICIQETWLTDKSDLSLFKIDGYNCISQSKICSAHGGLAI